MYTIVEYSHCVHNALHISQPQIRLSASAPTQTEHSQVERTNLAVAARERGWRPSLPGAGDAERCLRTSFGVAIAASIGSGGVRYQDVVVGPQEFRLSVIHFRLVEIGLFSRANIICPVHLLTKCCQRTM